MPVGQLRYFKNYREIYRHYQMSILGRESGFPVTLEGVLKLKEMADYTIEIPDADEAFLPILATILLQLLANHIAVLRGCNVDQPRNLAKSLTVG